MARKLREKFLYKYFYHIFNRGNNKKLIFKDDQDKSFFMNKVFDYFDKSDNKVWVICVMKNHFHILVEAGDNNDISKIMQKVCTSYAIYFFWKYSHVGHVFQGRFKSKLILSEYGILNVINYISENPVKKGYCDESGSYKWLWIKGSDPSRVRPSVPQLKFLE